jgi:2-oxoisovalerate dehydrogenase E1 component
MDAVNTEIEDAIRQSLADPPAAEADMRAAVYIAHEASYLAAETSTRAITFMQAINEALSQEGLFRASEGLYERFGPSRVRDTPISETGFVGAGIGAALAGLRPVVELQFFDFCTVAMDQITNQAAKLRFMMGGSPRIRLVIRGASGPGLRLGAQHSQSLEAWFCHTPGLVVVMPSNPFDAKGLLTAAIRDDNPVIFLEPKQLFFAQAEPVPEEPYAIALGRASVAAPG